MKRRTISEAERALWAHAMRDVAPLKPRRRKPISEAAVVATDPGHPPPERPRPAGANAKPVKPPGPPPLAAIDRNERRRLARGTLAIDARIDLHGLRQAEAHAALRHFLAGAQGRGARLVLVITGKGAPASGFHFEEERGVLRRVVPHWLAEPDLRPIVVGFEAAHDSHGGAGALYVRLRRPRPGGAS